jgi:hypothetical protein
LQLLASVLLIGIAGAAVLTAAAGARRTASAITRSARAAHASDVIVGPDISGPAPAAWPRVDALPEVASISTFKGLISAPLDGNGQLDARWFGPQVVGLDSKLLYEIDRPRVLSGRLPDPNVASEIAVNDTLARLVGVTAGSHVELRVVTESELAHPSSANGSPPGRPFPIIVTGVLVTRSDAIRDPSDPNLTPTVFYGPAAATTLAKYLGSFDAKVVRLKRGAADLGSFERHVRELMPGTPFVFQERPTTDARARRSERPYVLALALFAILGAVAAAAVIAQLIGRQQRLDSTDRTALQAIGFDRSNFVMVGVIEGAVVGGAGALLAGIGAVLASRMMPIGPVRRVEPHLGVTIDWFVLVVGLALIIGLVTLRSTLAAARVSLPPSRARRSAVPEALGRAGVAVPVVSGVRFATDGGRGESRVPVRSTMLGIGVALGAVIGALVYSAGLTHFTGTPRLYGWNWDAMVAPQTDDPASIAKLRALPKSPRVAAAAIASYATIEINRTTVAAVGFDAPPELTIADGRAPLRPDEVVLGATSQRLARARIGDWIMLGGATGSHRYHLVGKAVFPRLAPFPAAEPTGLGVGAGFSSEGLARLSGPQDPSWVLVQFRRDPRGARQTLQSLDEELFHGDSSLGTVLGPQRPNDAASYEHLTRTPFVLALLLVILAVGSAAHVLITSVRRRRRDLAVLKTIGFTRRQVATAVFAQASTLIGVAVIVAVPVGVVLGRWLWAATAHWLGIPVSQPFPFVGLALVVIGAFALANLLAFVPGRLAARIRPAVALRSE